MNGFVTKAVGRWGKTGAWSTGRRGGLAWGLWVWFSSLGLGLGSGFAEDLGSLFEVAVQTRAAPSARAGERSGSPLLLRTRTAERLWRGRSGDQWRMPDPTGAAFEVRVLEIRLEGGATSSVRGELVGDPGSEVLLVGDGEAVACTVRARSGRVWKVLPGPGGRHSCTEVDSEFGPECGNVAGRATGGGIGGGRRGLAVAAAGTVVGESILDLAFVYTRAAREAAGGEAGMRVLTELAVREANDAYARSGAAVQLRTVARHETAYEESGDLTTDLDRLSRVGEGWRAEVERLRNEVAADVVCLVVEFEDSQRFAGMANQLVDTSLARLERAFTVCVRPYLVGNYTLPHEVGHLLGCDHDRENAVGGALQGWSYGNRILVEGVQYRTVMAYRPGVQFPYFSSPDARFRGVPTGIATGASGADNVRTLNFTAPLLSRVRDPARRVGFERDRIRVSESAGVVRFRLVRSGALDAGSVWVTNRSGSAREGVDFVGQRRRVVWAAAADPGGTGAEVEVEVEWSLLDNAEVDGPRSFALVLSEPSPGLVLGPVGSMTVEIEDDETEAGAVLDTGFRPRPGTDYGVSALVVEAEDRVVVGGSFLTANGLPRSRLARFLADGTVDETFAPWVKYEVRAMARWEDGRLAVGGWFNTVNTNRYNHVAVLGEDGTPDPGFEFDTGTEGPVLALVALPGGKLLVGGAFSNVQGRAVKQIVRLLPSGQPDPTFRSDEEPDDEVRALATDGSGRVLLGGRFGRVGKWQRPGVARLLPDGGVDVAFAAEGDADGAVDAVASDGEGRVWVAGEFTEFMGAPAGRVARLTALGGLDREVGFGTGADGPVHALAMAADGRVWIGGRFRRFDGRPRSGVARLLADGGLDETFDPGVGPNDAVVVVVPGAEGGVWIGGWFTRVHGVARGGVARLLGARPEPAWFRGVRLGGGDTIEWEATGVVGQAYRVERSEDLREWRMETAVSAGSGDMRGRSTRSGGGPGFLRLGRNLE